MVGGDVSEPSVRSTRSWNCSWWSGVGGALRGKYLSEEGKANKGKFGQKFAAKKHTKHLKSGSTCQGGDRVPQKEKKMSGPNRQKERPPTQWAAAKLGGRASKTIHTKPTHPSPPTV